MPLLPTRVLVVAVALALSGCVAAPYGDQTGYGDYGYGAAPGYVSPIGPGYAFGYGPGRDDHRGWDHAEPARWQPGASHGGSPPVAHAPPRNAPAPSAGAAHYHAPPAPARSNGPEGGPNR